MNVEAKEMAVLDMRDPRERREHPREVLSIDENATPMQMLALAIQRGVDTDQLTRLMDLRDRWESGEARKAFVTAMARLKSEPIQIFKTKLVDIPGGAKFKHATLADVVDGVCQAMGKHGLSHKWVTAQEAGKITVTCVITHEAGHSESTALTASPDDSGKKNGIQQIASTVTYLERYTLMAATGLAASDMEEDDGRGAGGSGSTSSPSGPAKISESQIADLDALISEVGANKPKLLEYLKIKALSDIPVTNYASVVKIIERKRNQS